MALRASTMTADEFLAIPEGDRRYQLVDGELIVNEPVLRHVRIQGWIYARLALYCEAERGRGEVCLPADLRLDDRNVYAPDLWWVPDEQRPAHDAKRLEAPPPLVVEVRSPSTWRHDLGPKRAHYDAAGVAELWLVDTASDTVLVHRRSTPGADRFDVSLELRSGDTLTTLLLPGLDLDVATLFDR